MLNDLIHSVRVAPSIFHSFLGSGGWMEGEGGVNRQSVLFDGDFLAYF